MHAMISRVRRRRRPFRRRARSLETHTHIVMQAPTVVVNQNASRETGSIARANNIAAAKAVSDVVRTTLGPRSMLKMILDASGGACDASFERSGGWGRGRARRTEGRRTEDGGRKTEDGREEEDGQRVGGETTRDAKPPRRTATDHLTVRSCARRVGRRHRVDERWKRHLERDRRHAPGGEEHD
jgi:hypothetical protein